MEDRTARDIDRIRLRLIDLIKSFFVEEPDAERLSRWRGIFTALVQEQISQDIDKAVTEISSLLESKSLKEIQEEYYELIENPFGNKNVNLSASFYKDGRSHAQTLANYRDFLNEADIIKSEEVTDAEDELPVMLDCLASLIEMDGEEGRNTVHHQGTLVNDYLGPLSVSLLGALVESEHAVFYEACGRFIVGYVELEKGLFELV